jgi:hypothetical protein
MRRGAGVVTPYYDDGTCQCGCGVYVSKRFVSGHNLRVLERTEIHRANLASSQREAWQTKRTRLPLGATRKDRQGYVLVKVVAGAGQWRKEHHLVMEEALGRRLAPGEQVHHINGIKDDNRLDNLYLCASGAHHQAVEATYQSLLAGLLQGGAVIFDVETGSYRRG